MGSIIATNGGSVFGVTNPLVNLATPKALPSLKQGHILKYVIKYKKPPLFYFMKTIARQLISKVNPDKVFATAQNIVPKHTLSTLVATLAKSEKPYIKKPLIYGFAKTYGISLGEYQRDNFQNYDSFNDFFTRELKDGARAIDSTPDSIVCPADGTVSQIGTIDQSGQALQAKGHTYHIAQLLADYDDGEALKGGSFATIYLAPNNYHRVHMPFNGTLVQTRYVPGELFSVNNATASHIPDLFARNERLVCVFDTNLGRCFVVLVGAMIVAGIECVATGRLERGHSLVVQDHQMPLQKGDELGRFYLGSTAIVVMPATACVSWQSDFYHGRAVQMGETMGISLTDQTNTPKDDTTPLTKDLP